MSNINNGAEGNQQLYQQLITVLPEYPPFHGKPEMCDAPNINQGWKLHLNVEPANAVVVSEYLKNRGYNHKYLGSANIDRGKVFTVYIGSRQLTEQSVRDIQDNIGYLLKDPADNCEARVSPKISARFAVYFHDKFEAHAYLNGVPLHKYYDENNIPLALAQSTKMLTDEFGGYFGGGIEYYDPDNKLSPDQ